MFDTKCCVLLLPNVYCVDQILLTDWELCRRTERIIGWFLENKIKIGKILSMIYKTLHVCVSPLHLHSPVQGLWLLPAYYLEFQGYNTFIYIWTAGIVFFLINVHIVVRIIQNHSFQPTLMNGTSTKCRQKLS